MAHGSEIDINEAIDCINRFKHKHGDDAVRAQTFDKHHIANLISHPDCTGIRIYNGYRNNEQGVEVPCMVLFAINGNENMINHVIIERGSPCPRYCGNDGHVEISTQE